MPRAPCGAAGALTRSRENLLSGHREGPMNLTMFTQALEQAVMSVPIAEVPSLLGLLEKAKAMTWSRMIAEKQDSNEERLLTAGDIAKRLQLSEYRVRELIRQGKIKRAPVDGRTVRVKPSDLQAYLAQQGS